MFYRVPLLNAVKTVSRMRRVPISADPRNELIGLYNQTLSVLSQLPPNAFYKNATQAITQERLNLVQNTQDVEEIVRLTKVLQVEQLILEAQDELKLIEEVKETKPWESLEEPAPKGQWE